MSEQHAAKNDVTTVWCSDYKAQVEHPTHWHVIRAGGITYAQGQCPGRTRVIPPGSSNTPA